MVQGDASEKLKFVVTDFVRLDEDIRSRAQDRFANALYGKFLGRPLPLDIVTKVLLDRWKEWGKITIADIPNGYFLIRCDSQLALQNILFNGPRTINGLVL